MHRLPRVLAVLAALVFGSVTLPLNAQQGRFELTPTIGYRLNSNITNTDVAQYSELQFKNAATYGVAFSWNFSPATSAEITYDYSSYDATAVARTIGNDRTINIKQHDILVNGLYLFNTGNDAFRPFILGGLGMTILAPGGNLNQVTNFAWTLGGGFKYYTSDKFGLRFDIRWLPTYLYSAGGGTWCDPYYGCYYYPNSHILNQWDFKLGFVFRF